MTRITLISFLLLTGFFYATGKPTDQNGAAINTFADLSNQNIAIGLTSSGSASGLSNKGASIRITRNVSSEPRPAVGRKNAALPAMPVRNPRRMQAPPLYAKIAPAVVPKTSDTVVMAVLGKQQPATSFGEARIKNTDATIKPLVVSYQQRFQKPKAPILGPRLTAVLIKRELRRIGCYDGNVTSNWDGGVKSAIEKFNASAGTDLATTPPSVAALEKLQKATGVVCRKKPENGRQILAAVPLPNVANKGKPITLRTNVRYKKTASRDIPTSTSASRKYNSIGRADFLEPQKRRIKRRVKKRRISRPRRSKRYRVSRRKARRRTAVRSWRRTYRRKRFGFRRSGGFVTLGN